LDNQGVDLDCDSILEFFKKDLTEELKEIIKRIKIDKSNLEHIAQNGNINGSLLLSIEEAMKEFVTTSDYVKNQIIKGKIEVLEEIYILYYTQGYSAPMISNKINELKQQLIQ